MLEKWKAFRRLKQEIHTARKTAHDKDGRQILQVHVSDDSAFLSPLSPDETPMIGAETAEFLSHSVQHLRPDTALHIQIDGDCIDETERCVYEKAIRNYYHAEFCEALEALRRGTVQAILFTVIAALIFAFAVVLDHHGVESVFLNMIAVVAWVFMWEAADLFFLQGSALRLKRMRAYHMASAVISFSAVPQTAPYTV